MNPTKRAKLEADANQALAVVIAALQNAMASGLHCYISDLQASRDASAASQAPTAFSKDCLVQALEEADQALRVFDAKLLDVLKRVPQDSDYGLAVDFTGLLRIMLRLLSIQRHSPKRERMPQAVFDAFLRELPLAHNWALTAIHSLLTRYCVGCANMAAVLEDLTEVLAFFLKRPESIQAVERSYITLACWIWSDSAALLVPLRKALGKLLAEYLVAKVEKIVKSSGETGKVDIDYGGMEGPLEVIGRMVLDPAASGMTQLIAEHLFDLSLDLLHPLPFQKLANSSNQEAEQLAVQIIRIATVGCTSSIPGYVNPKLPVVLRTVSALAFRVKSDAVRGAAKDALIAFEVLIHPRRPLPIVMPSTKRARISKLEAEAGGEAEPKETNATATSHAFPSTPFAGLIRNVDAITEFIPSVPQKPLQPQIEQIEKIAAAPSPAVEGQQSTPTIVHAPRVDAMMDVDAEDGDDEPLPQLVLD
jgi:hypothetical protein